MNNVREILYDGVGFQCNGDKMHLHPLYSDGTSCINMLTNLVIKFRLRFRDQSLFRCFKIVLLNLLILKETNLQIISCIC